MANIILKAKDFDKNKSKNVKVNPSYNNLVTSSNGSNNLHKMVYFFNAPTKRDYNLTVSYAAAQSRPVSLIINEVEYGTNILDEITGGWTNVDNFDCGTIPLEAGQNKLIIQRVSVIPHLEKYTFFY